MKQTAYSISENASALADAATGQCCCGPTSSLLASSFSPPPFCAVGWLWAVETSSCNVTEFVRFRSFSFLHPG